MYFLHAARELLVDAQERVRLFVQIFLEEVVGRHEDALQLNPQFLDVHVLRENHLQRVQLPFEVCHAVRHLVELLRVFHGLQRVQVLFDEVEHFFLFVDERSFLVNPELELDFLPTLLDVVDVLNE